MALTTMYPAKVNSPELTISTKLLVGVNIVVVSGDISKLPVAPNMFTVGTGEDAETIYYPTDATGTDPYTFTGVTRGFNSTTPNEWPVGTSVARLFTAYDHDTFRTNILELEASKADLSIPLYDIMVYQEGGYTKAIDSNGDAVGTPVLISNLADNTVFASAFTSCPSGGTIICKGSFTIAAGLTISKSVTFEGLQGCTITLGALIDGIGFDFDGWTGAPTKTEIKAVTPALIHRDYIYVTDYANINVGDLLEVQDSVVFGTTDSLTCGEVVRVRAKTPLDRLELYDTFTTGYLAGGDVHIYHPIEVHVRNINFAAASETDSTFVVRFICCADSSMEGCRVIPLGEHGIQISNCYNFSFNGNKMYNAVVTGGGYGVSASGGRNIHITNNHITNCRHPITGGSSSLGSNASEPVNIFVEGNTLTSLIATGSGGGFFSMCAVDVHAAWSIFIKNNIGVHPIADTSIGDYPATLIGAKYCVIEGNDFENFTHINQPRGLIANRQLIIRNNRFKMNPYLSGVAYQYMVYEVDATGSVSYDTYVVDGNDIWEGNIAKLSSIAAPLPITELVITNNLLHTVSTTHQVADSCGVDITGYANVRVDNNTINSVGADAIRITSCTGTCKGNKIYNPGRRATGTNYGIQLIGTAATSMFVTENECKCSDNYMTYGIGETGTAANLSNTIFGNYISGAYTSQLLLPAATATVALQSKPTYDAMVYQSGLYTTAVDKNGNVLSSVTTASKTDHTPIQAAIDYAYTIIPDSNATKGRVLIRAGHYHPNAMLTLSAGVHVMCEHNTVYFHIETNSHDFCFMKPRSLWEGGYIYYYAVGIDVFTTNCFKFYANDSYSSHYGEQGIRNVVINNQGITTCGGNAIYLYSDNSSWPTQIGIYGLVIEDIRINGKWEYGIHFYEVGTNLYGETMSWNTFRNIWFYQNKYCLYMESAGTYDCMDCNTFENMFIQPRSVAPYNVDGFVISGEANVFINCTCADWGTDEGYQWRFTSKGVNNTLYGCYVDYVASHAVTDAGSGNKFVNCGEWVTENKGRTSVTLTSGSGTITHGLVSTPTWAICNASTNGDSVAITTLGATTLTIKVTTAAGGDGTTQYINWMCGV